MHDQRVEARPALGGENRGDGRLARRVAAQPVDGLGGKGDEPACAQKRGATGDLWGRGRENGSGHTRDFVESLTLRKTGEAAADGGFSHGPIVRLGTRGFPGRGFSKSEFAALTTVKLSY